MISLKNILLAGIGSVAYTYEKAAELVEEMVKKGEITVKQGKDLTDELKKKTFKSMDVAEDKLNGVLSNIQSMTKTEIDEVKKKINELEKK
ncbi:hypothetical protein PV797_21145 [Clostridiaceae bacterium M8S5]|nr:hypothetical protein PV797_21145 [Clostridiaceae bacterium M8S5]